LTLDEIQTVLGKIIVNGENDESLIEDSFAKEFYAFLFSTINSVHRHTEYSSSMISEINVETLKMLKSLKKCSHYSKLSKEVFLWV
jgi:hypothetical protein